MTRPPVLFALFLFLACAKPGAHPLEGAPLRGYQAHEDAEAPGFPLRALSLRTLQQTLAKCAPSKGCPEEALSFGRISRILGYSLDRDNRDVLIFGLADPAFPAIHLEDFLVALRSSWLRYVHGNVYTSPGCDIRPNPDLVRRLQEVGEKLADTADPSETEAVLKTWKSTCEMPQEVTVLGIPFDTHFGHVLVAADYDMKRLADGSDALEMPGLESVMGLELRSAQEAIKAHHAVSVRSSMNRFWLTPGDQLYEESDGITWLRASPVRIRTHPIGAGAGGNLNDVAGVDPAAEEFARRFSTLYEKVAEHRPIYRELGSLFQIFALTQTLHFRGAPDQVGLDLGYLLDLHPLPPFSVERQVLGRHAVRQFRHEHAVPGGIEILQLWMPSCGGVEMSIEPSEGSFLHRRSEPLAHLQGRLAESRPTTLPLAWNVDPGSEERLAEAKGTLEQQELNRPGSPLVVTIYDRKSAYHAVGDLFSLSYRGLDIGVLVGQVGERLKDLPEETTVYFKLEGFSADKAEVFTEECKSRLQQMRPGVEVRALRDIEGTLMQKVLFTPGVRFERAEGITKVVEGAAKGLYRAVFTFSVQVLDRMCRFTMTVLFADSTLAHAFLANLQARFTLAGSLDLSAIELANLLRRELGQAARDIKIEIQLFLDEANGQFDKSQSVDLSRPRTEREA